MDADSLGPRRCGPCAACCKLPAIAELSKPPFRWCRHCRPGNEEPCSIYPERPQVCRDFECGWLRDRSIPAWMRPDASGVMFEPLPDGEIGVWEFIVGALQKRKVIECMTEMSRRGARFRIRSSWELVSSTK